ncbi:unnamed protein product [Albugo candida]|uniref:Uncharacterized protein n=1 Tax=Albugo candida TaxID=65357 RepID=A0A024FV04_9STRA|nr:unnamed protein product [Albugo candida]|eukprot:CCI10955.1 unnamed protein product [Albugo candida]
MGQSKNTHTTDFRMFSIHMTRLYSFCVVRITLFIPPPACDIIDDVLVMSFFETRIYRDRGRNAANHGKKRKLLKQPMIISIWIRKEFKMNEVAAVSRLRKIESHMFSNKPVFGQYVIATRQLVCFFYCAELE